MPEWYPIISWFVHSSISSKHEIVRTTYRDVRLSACFHSVLLVPKSRGFPAICRLHATSPRLIWDCCASKTARTKTKKWDRTQHLWGLFQRSLLDIRFWACGLEEPYSFACSTCCFRATTLFALDCCFFDGGRSHRTRNFIYGANSKQPRIDFKLQFLTSSPLDRRDTSNASQSFNNT